jgi:thiol-disulfide isomerase/thioredoxin
VDAADLATMPQGSDNEPAMALAGKPAPAFTLKDLEGKSVELGQLKGSVVVLDFWATWCGPCVQSLPHIAELSREQGPKGLKVFAVNQQEGEAEVKQFLSAHSELNGLTVLLDSDGAVGAKYLANAIPETVVIGKDGVIKKVFVGAGPGTAQQIHAAVASLSLGGGVLITGCAAQQSPPAPSAQQGELYRILRYDYSSNRQALFQLVMARNFLRRYGGSPVLANADPSLAEWTQWADRAADWLIHQKDRDRIEREFHLMTIRSPSPTGGSVATTSDWQHFLETKARLPSQVYLQWVEAGILGNGQRMMDLSARDNAVDAQLAELYRDNAFAVARFRKSVDAKFGPGATSKLDASKIAMVGIHPGLLNEPLEENINGDDATLTDKEYTIVLKKIDGAWKLRISSMGSITSGQSLAIASEVIHTSTTAWDRLTKAIEDGEITSIEELRQLL